MVIVFMMLSHTPFHASYSYTPFLSNGIHTHSHINEIYGIFSCSIKAICVEFSSFFLPSKHSQSKYQRNYQITIPLFWYKFTTNPSFPHKSTCISITACVPFLVSLVLFLWGFLYVYVILFAVFLDCVELC